MNRKALLAAAEVDNPYFSTDHAESAVNPRRIQAFINRNADAVTAMRSLKPHQKRAADHFIDIWRTLNGMHSGAFGEHVDNHHAPSIAENVIDAGNELQQCKGLIGARNYALLEEVCGRGKSLTDLFPVKRDGKEALVRLERRIASHNIKTSLDDLARKWRYLM